VKLKLGMVLGGILASFTLAQAGSMRVLTEADPSSQLARIKIVVRSGSLADPEGYPGGAYFTARGMLRGTRTRPYAELNREIEKLGGSIGVSIDATKTVFDGAVLAENLDPFLDLLRDIFTQPEFNLNECSTLQGIIQGELKSALEDPQVLASRGVQRALYSGTRMQYPAQGTVSGVGLISPGVASQFFKTHYLKSNLLIGITAPLSAEIMIAKIVAKLDAIADGVAPVAIVPQPQFNGSKAYIIERPGLATVPTFVATSGVGDADPDSLALDLGNLVFGGDFTSRLMQELRAKNGWTYGVYSSYNQIFTPMAEAGLYSIYLYPTAGFEISEGEIPFKSISTTLRMLQDPNTGYETAGIEAVEFTRAKSALLNSYPFDSDTAAKRLASKVREALTGHPNLNTDQFTSALNQLTQGSVNQAISRHARTENLAIVTVGDSKHLKSVFNKLTPVIPASILDIQP